jgi:hypothetical protein
MKIGNIELPKYAALAPLAGVGDRAMREISREFGAVWTVGEMTSSKGLSYGSKKSAELLEINEAERPCAVQLFGSEPEVMAEAAKLATDATSQSHYYYGVPDTYWASYNQTDTGKSITGANVKALIINSASDRQIFEADIALWDTLFKDNANVSVRRFDDISHFGYKINTSDPTAVYQHAEFPKELITAFSEFIKTEP